MSDSKFRNQCDQLIQLLSLDKQHFFSLPDNASRIKYVFSLCESVPDLFPPPAISKHHGQATVSKEHGNTCFDEENYSGAIQEYNVAISMCPQDTCKYSQITICYFSRFVGIAPVISGNNRFYDIKKAVLEVSELC